MLFFLMDLFGCVSKCQNSQTIAHFVFCFVFIQTGLFPVCTTVYIYKYLFFLYNGVLFIMNDVSLMVCTLKLFLYTIFLILLTVLKQWFSNSCNSTT